MREPAAWATVDILGVRVGCLSRFSLLEQVSAWISQAQPRWLAYVNAHCLNLACQDAEYRRLLNQADLVYPDGIGVVWAGRFLDRRRQGSASAMTKLTGADWIDDFCKNAVIGGWRVYLLGGKAGVAQRAAQTLQARHPGLQIAGASQGYFQPDSSETVLAEINASSAQVVLIGMGVPRQEKWLGAYRTQIAAPLCWTVGALFDYLAGVERRAPRWLNALGLEWFWRFWMDPRGKWRRYWLGNPRFVLRVLRQRFM